jgi:Gpi18-like mannosyltransferase
MPKESNSDKISQMVENTKKEYDLCCQRCDRGFDRAFDFVFKEHGYISFGIIITIFCLAMRYAVVPFISSDLSSFVLPWLNNMRANGGLKSLSSLQGDYFPAYLTILALISYLPSGPSITAYATGYSASYFQYDIYYVKTISIIFDLAMAFGVMMIAKHFEPKKKAFQLISYSMILIMPTIFSNSAVWGQLDSSYACFLVWTIYFLLEKKPTKSMIFYGLAFAFKLQSIFLLPLFAYLWLFKQFKLRYLFIALGTMVATYIPCWIMGASFLAPFEHIFAQFGEYPNLNYSSGSIFVFFEDIWNTSASADAIHKLLSTMGIFLTISGVLIVLAALYKYHIEPDSISIVGVAALFCLLCPYLMPHMHERYFFAADVTILVYILMSHKKYYLIVLSQLSSLICISWFLYGKTMFPGEYNYKISGIINAFMIAIIIKMIFIDNKKAIVSSVPTLSDVKKVSQ